jgi:hypothetical protein
MTQTVTPQQVSYAQQETHQITYMPEIPILPQQPITLSTHPKQQQQAEHHSQKQKKAWTVMTMTSYPGKQSVSGRGKKQTRPRTTKVPTMKKNKLQGTNNHPPQIRLTDKFEALRHAETEGNTEHKRKDPAPPPIFVPGITNMQRLTATRIIVR